MDLLGWAMAAFVVSLVAGLLGFTGIVRGAASAAKVLFGLFLVVAIVLIALALLGVNVTA